MQWAWTESQLSEKLILKKKAVLGPDDDGKTVVILSRLIFQEIEVRTDLRHRETLFAEMKKLVGTSTKSVVIPAARAQERFDKERTLFRRVTMRASYMSSNRDDAQQVTEEKARFLSESNEEVCSIPNQTQITPDVVGHGRQMQVISEQRDVKAPHEDTDSDHAERVPRRKSTIKIGSCIQSTRSLSVAESEFDAGVQGEFILLEAKSLMMIGFGNDVRQCVLGTDSSLVKRVVERPMLWFPGRVESGEIRTEKWKGEYNTADSEIKPVSVEVLRNRHLKMLKWSNARDVISQR